MQGRVRAIGVCNHNPDHLYRLIDRTGMVPAVNQIELHPRFTQHVLREVDTELGVLTQSRSPLNGGPNTHPDQTRRTAGNLLEHPVITRIATEHGKTPAQIILRWHLQHGLSTIPTTVHLPHLTDNINIFDFTLTHHNLTTIDALDTGIRTGPNPDTVQLSDTPHSHWSRTE